MGHQQSQWERGPGGLRSPAWFCLKGPLDEVMWGLSLTHAINDYESRVLTLSHFNIMPNETKENRLPAQRSRNDGPALPSGY